MSNLQKERADKLSALIREVNSEIPDKGRIQISLYGGPSGIYVDVSYDDMEEKEYCSNENTVGADVLKALARLKKIDERERTKF